ncbi:P-loop containing nucleoside triphosphate hydrolase protein [Dothidotthia symphoricarpi CBS 119687]|uniref:P-loop containing nucleoside triphosphate hydrolase protein n=1 Tax=Dothidotthia symphoricarpi CBS 119687 TaxID=1392245 RepID=A0A6A6A6B4_9PLEO|nr:P-loop containing nucleoside triphosphate hydrolase protein [Dothidotthia symphoricarpi CBS 119687]KAF2126457.1 P-loop containing nucleoside triphosphate hydrolase protein [Dothidotthia symphoricarpi CBS 119687]
MTKELVADTFLEAILDLVRRIEKLLASASRQRILIALAGVPGSGKSTVSHALLAELALRNIHDVAVVPMDGFHYTRATLSTFEAPELAFRRRGAPFTFDAEAIVKLVKTLKTTPVTTGEEPEILVHVPSFDHAVKDPVQDAIPVSSRNRIIVIEGNYTLLNQSPWNEIAELSDERWFVDAPIEVVKERLAQRHLAAGIETSALAAIKRAEENDIPNGELIRRMLIKPDVTIEN